MLYMYMLTKYLLVAAAIMFGIVWARPVIAVSQFSQEVGIKYVFDEAGNADVTKQVKLTNLDEHVYPSEYVLSVPEDAVNITAFDQAGKVDITLTTTDGQKYAVLQLNKKNFGINNTTEFALVYQTRQLAREQGDVWEITIPPLISSEQVATVTLEITVPDTWGIPFSTEPRPNHDLTWTNKELGSAEIRMMVSKKNITPSPTPLPEDATGISDTPGFSPYTGVGLGIVIVGVALISMYAIQHI